MAQLSASTRRYYGSQSPYFIPATFLYKLRGGVTPHVCQIAALSEITGYRFVDWLRLCGFDLREIPRLQMRLHTERTVLITPTEGWSEPSFSRPSPVPAGNPNLRPRAPERWSGKSRYLFAKIGARDAMVYPALLPGGMVRVDPRYAHPVEGCDSACKRDQMWLVEQPSGLICSRVQWIDQRQIVLLPNRPPWGSWPLHLPTEARILGLVDMGSRPLMLPRMIPPIEPAQPALPHREAGMRFSDLLRISRARTGLTFRAAHRLTRTIAHILDDPEYTIALGLLSDYEAMGKLPRHIAKILSLCMIYCMDFRELLQVAGLQLDDSAKLPLPTPDRFHLHSNLPRHSAPLIPQIL
ncbi:MAG: hypothetical protein ACRD20_09670 [Terriglobales bacterium]